MSTTRRGRARSDLLHRFEPVIEELRAHTIDELALPASEPIVAEARRDASPVDGGQLIAGVPGIGVGAVAGQSEGDISSIRRRPPRPWAPSP